MAKVYTLEELQKHVSTSQKNGTYTFGYMVEEGNKLPALKCLWGPYIFENSLIHFPSIRGSAKSLLMMQLCIAISCKQTEFLGEKIDQFNNPKTIYFDFEMPETFIQRRSALLYKNSPFPIDEYFTKILFFCTRLSFEDSFKEIIEAIQRIDPVLIVIDNIRTALKNSNTNSSVDMGNFFSIMGGIREIYHCAIVVVDHVRKGTRNQKTESDNQSGSGCKTDLSDGDFQIRHSCQDKNLRLIRRLKSRMFAESDETKLVRLNPDTLWFELIASNCIEAEHIGLADLTDKEMKIDMAKVMLFDQGKTYAEVSESLGIPISTLHRWIGKSEDKV